MSSNDSRGATTLSGRPIPTGLLAALLVTILAVLLYAGARENSVTVDEMAHLPAGIVYLQSGRFAVYRHNPPLLRMLAAAPLVATGITIPGAENVVDRWQLGLAFQRSLGSRYHAVFFRARVVMLLLTCATALLLFVAARTICGDAVALLALALFVFSPTVLAHGALVTTDAGFMLAFLATMVATAALIRRRTWSSVFILGTVLGLAELTKFTALLLYPMVIVLLLLAGRWRAGVRVRALQIVVVLAVSLAWLNAGYLFRGTGSTLRSFSLLDARLAALAVSPLGRAPLPFPRDYVLGFDAQLQEASGRFEVYLHGERTRTGWWYYLPIALIYKEPPSLFLLLAAVAWLAVRGRLRATSALRAAAAVSGAALVAFMLLTNVDLGVRYVLFLLPFAYFIAAHIVLPVPSRARRLVAGVCLAWYAASSLRAYPDFLSYFSEAVGGVDRGHEILADSNLDWGQDLVRLKRWMESREVATVALSHYGLVDPAVYGIAYEPLGPSPLSDTVVISTNHLLGIHPWPESVGAVAPYRDRAPRERIGATLWVFDAIRPDR